jgi:FkbM family methyltransferase
MELFDIHKVEAIHPHWRAFVILSTTDNSALHEEHGSRGTYTLADRMLTINWDRFAPDVFLERSGVYVHKTMLDQIPDMDRLFAVTAEDKVFRARKVSVLVPDGDYEVSLRLGTSDTTVFKQVFVWNEYESPHLPASADTIVDLGANIGLATVFFGLKYPDARILAVEPEAGNFAALLGNTSGLGERVQKRQRAAWTYDGDINLHTENQSGHLLGAWGVQVSDRQSASNRRTPCRRLGTLLHEAGFADVDILKVDIEGAEYELFSEAAHDWIPRIKNIVIETHERFRPGSDEAVRSALRPLFEELPASGENLFFRRIGT